jgi:hypothetical protein
MLPEPDAAERRELLRGFYHAFGERVPFRDEPVLRELIPGRWRVRIAPAPAGNRAGPRIVRQLIGTY